MELAWPFVDVAEAACAGLQELAAALDAEQSPRGLDGQDEVRLHPALAAGLTRRGFGCAREQRYPLDLRRRKRSEGKRCDLVVSAGDVGPSPDRALWIEVKAVAQYGEGGPNRGWAHALTRPAWRDVERLARDPSLRLRAVLLILFTETESVALHDLAVWTTLGRARGFALAEPVLRSHPLVDRFGNRRTTTALFPIAGLAGSSVD